MNPRDKIIKCTIELFSRKGYEGTSIRDIAQACDINVAMVNYYFGSKEKLFENVIEDKLSYLRNLFTELVKNKKLTAIQKMDTIIDLVIERKFSNKDFNQLLHRELSLESRPQLKDKISSLLMLNITPVKQILKDGMNSGEFKEVDLEMTVATVIGTIHYLLISDEMCRKILGKRGRFSPYHNIKLKQRVSEHAKQLIRAHLLN